ncbi:hypothetical protein AAW14_00545 [Streptomyces hygroscopicus]|nr:hypothetical protein [Streptomyces hygroscopicus]
MVEQFAGAGRLEDRFLDVGVGAVEAEDVAGRRRVAEPVTDGLDPAGGTGLPSGPVGRYRWPDEPSPG